MKINLEFLSVPIIIKIVGKKSVTFDFSGKTVNDLIHEIINAYGEKVGKFLLDESGNLDSVFTIMLNKADYIRREQMNTELHDGDQVTLMMLVAGG